MRTAALLHRIILVAAAVLMALLTGCRKELCYDHDEHGLNVRTWIRPEWERVWMRPYDGTGIFYRRHISPEGGLLHLPEGHQDLLFYNDDTEYIVITGTDSYADARATTRTRTRASYAELHPDEETVNSPDMLYSAWFWDYEGIESPETDTLDILLRPLVYNYVLIFEIEAGIELVHRACGTLAGMAGTVYLQDVRTGDGKVSVLFDDALVDTRNSTVIAAVHTFGVPGYDYGSRPASSTEEGTFAASIELTLSTGTYIFEADISAQMAGLPRGGVITVQVPEITPEGGDGMFEVSVGDWNHEEVPLPL